MEKLEPSVRDTIKIMSEERLVVKLLKAGLEEEAIVEMSRKQLVNAWAELVPAGREQPNEALAAAGKVLGYDMDLERQRLAFEMKKFEREIAIKEERLAREAAEKEERLAAERKREEREAAEKEERFLREETAQRLREAELRLQEEQLARQKERDAWHRDRKKMPAAQAKFFGDVLKNVMPKFPSDVADAPIFFAGVEKLFDSFSVPGELQSKLLMPYLNEKAKSLLLRLDKDKQDVYSEVKKFLLRELKLTPVQFKDRFDRAQRNSDETYTMFCSRLKNLLTYYCQSRSLGDSFDKLFSLCVADKIKSTLSEARLDHTLTVEGNKWLQCEDLADTIDTYLSNHTYEGRPKTPGQASSKFYSSSVNSSRKANANNSRASNASGYSNNSACNRPNYAQSGKSDAKVGCGATESKNGGKNKGLCYICHSPNHRQYNCPTRGSQAIGTSQAKAPVARNFACAVETHVVGETDVDEVPARITVCPPVVSTGNNKSTDGNGHVETSNRALIQSSALVRNASNNTAASETESRVSGETFRSARVAIGESDVSDLNHQRNLQNFSKLSYVPICIQGVTGNHDALNDSGSQVNLIKRDLLHQLPCRNTDNWSCRHQRYRGPSNRDRSSIVGYQSLHYWISNLHRRKLVA
jgi:hypothetical protein